MNKVKMIFAIQTVIFAVLGLTKAISYDISHLMTTAGLIVVLFCCVLEELRAGKKFIAVIDFLFAVVFLILLVIRVLRIVE